MATSLLAVAHLGLLGVWLGSMLYSLVVVQPRATRHFGPDDDALEEFLTVLGSGNRRPVVMIILATFATGALLTVVATPTTTQAVLYAVEAALLMAAAGTFARVSWRLWPRRVFALPEERPHHRAALRRHALAMTGLVAATFAVATVAIAMPT